MNLPSSKHLFNSLSLLTKLPAHYFSLCVSRKIQAELPATQRRDGFELHMLDSRPCRHYTVNVIVEMCERLDKRLSWHEDDDCDVINCLMTFSEEKLFMTSQPTLNFKRCYLKTRSSDRSQTFTLSLCCIYLYYN